jgi:ATP-binding cassette, subfamily B, multidrug efflux pump
MAAPKPSRLGWIWGIWRERKLLIALLFALTLLSSAVAVAYPYLSKLLIDMIQGLIESASPASEAEARIRRLVMAVLAVGALGFVANLFPGVRGAVNSVFDYIIRKKYFGEVLRKDYRFFASFRSGDVVTRLTDDIYDFPKLSWFLCSGIFRAVESISKVAFCLAAMLLLDWRLTLISLIPLPLMVAVFAIAQDRIYDSFKSNQEAISDINSQLEMSFSGLRIIKAYSCEAKYRRFFAEALARRFATEMSVAKLGTILMMVYMYIDYVMQIGVVFVGGFMAVKGSISIGTFYALYNYLGMLVYPILDIPQLFVSGKRAFVNIDRLEEMRAYASRRSSGREFPPGPVESLEVESLGFGYDDRARILNGVSFELKKGERLAVVGRVGSGKSTLVKILAGLLEPTEGRVKVNGVCLAEAEEAGLARIMGYVPQEPLLFSGSVRDNVAFGTPGDGCAISDQALDEALRTAQVSEEVRGFRDGENTLLGQRGASLSGGQRQRIALARAIARSPRLLLLDDVTASLDARNEERLMNALALWSGELACVIVSHRLSTLQYADKILFLDSGELRAFGVHEELMASNGPYRAYIDEHFGEPAAGPAAEPPAESFPRNPV